MGRVRDARAALSSRWRAFSLAALAAVVAMSIGGCVAGDAPLARDSARERLAQFPRISIDDAAGAAFAAHRRDAAAWIASGAASGRGAPEIALNLPFERQAAPGQASRGTFLLFHGLNDSPYVWRGLAAALSERGFDTRAVLLSGHGSTADDMLHVRMEDWLAEARHHLRAVQADGRPVWLGGFSMGAVLATRLALERDDVAGLLLISPAFDSRLNHLLRWSGLYARRNAWVFGTRLIEDNPIKYNSIAVNSGWQYFRLSNALKRAWGWRKRIAVPTLLVHSVDDSVVDIDYTTRLFERRFTHPGSRLLSYAADAERAPDCERCVDARARVPAQRVLSASHLGLMYPPDDPLFGVQGSVLVCNGNEYPVFMACMRGRNHWFGAQHTPSPDASPVARSTYNPDWDATLSMLDDVLLTAPSR